MGKSKAKKSAGNSNDAGAKAIQKIENSISKRWFDVSKYTKHEYYPAVILLLVAIATRFWRLEDPPAVVFDEHHL